MAQAGMSAGARDEQIRRLLGGRSRTGDWAHAQPVSNQMERELRVCRALAQWIRVKPVLAPMRVVVSVRTDGDRVWIEQCADPYFAAEISATRAARMFNQLVQRFPDDQLMMIFADEMTTRIWKPPLFQLYAAQRTTGTDDFEQTWPAV